MESTTMPETTSEIAEEIIEEISYMEQYKDMVVEMPPAGIEDTLAGVVYPEFEKYTYYSTTAERDTNVNVLLPPNYSEEKEYPVVYILHGYYDNEDWMTRPDGGSRTNF